MSINKGNKKMQTLYKYFWCHNVFFYYYFVVLFSIKLTGLCDFFLGVNPACTYIYSLDWVIWNWNIRNTLPYWHIRNFNSWTSVSPSLIKTQIYPRSLPRLRDGRRGEEVSGYSSPTDDQLLYWEPGWI